jgi:hypothetical protein
VLDLKTKMNFMDFKSSDDELQKENSKWEIINYLRRNYKYDEKDLITYKNNINRHRTLERKADELYGIIFKNDTGPKNIAKFMIELRTEFPRNAKVEAIEKIVKYESDNPTPEHWLKFFKEKLPKIFKEYKKFEILSSVNITLVDKKL